MTIIKFPAPLDKRPIVDALTRSHGIDENVSFSIRWKQIQKLAPNHGDLFLNKIKSISSRWRPRRPNPVLNSAGLDETSVWRAPNFQPAPQEEARRSVYLAYFYK
jgi:hypothetical protein